MGGFVNLGHAATGFEQARQQDLARQHEDEQARRSMLGGFLQKLAMDETVHPDVRNAASQGYLDVVNTPGGQQLKWEKVLKQVHDAAAAVHPRPSQQFTPPPVDVNTPPPGLNLQTGQAYQSANLPPTLNAALSTQQPPVRLTPPPMPPGMFMPAEDVTRMQASRVGALTSAQAGAEAGPPVMQLGPNGQMNTIIPSKQPGQTFENTFNPTAMRGWAAMIHPVSIVGPEGVPVPALQNKMTGEVYDQDMNVIPNAQVFAPSLVPTVNQGFKQVQQADGSIALVPVTTTSQKVPGPPKGTASKSSGVPPPPPGMSMPSVRSGVGTPRTVGHTAPPPALQDKIQEQFQMRNSAIGLIDDITRNKKVLDGLLSSGKIAVAASPDGSGVLSRAANLTDQEAQVAGDFQQLIEHANLLRGPLGATGFRGKEAWGALQAQRGKPMADPRITAQVMQGMRTRLVSLNKADSQVLSGKGVGTGEAEMQVGGHKVGEVITHSNGQSIKITKIYPDGTFDAEPVKAGAKK